MPSNHQIKKHNRPAPNAPTTEIDSMLKDMQSSDYDNLLKVFDKHFGDFVILERSIVE